MNDASRRRFCGLLGLAAKAGRVQSGSFSAEKSVKKGRARLCLVADDASAETKKQFADMCAFRGIPLITDILDKEMMGHAIGRGMRAVVAVEDGGFSEAMRALTEGGNADDK